MIGIYKITNKITGQTYIGCSVDVLRRWKEHIKNIARKKNCNKKLCEAVEEYGITNFTFEIVEIIDNIDDIFKIEQKYIDSLNLESDYNKINSLRSDDIDGNRKINDFIEWLDTNWITIDEKELEHKIYKEEDKNEFVKMAIKYNILNIYPCLVSFNKIIKFIKDIGYIVEDHQRKINHKNTRFKIILDKPTTSMV